MSRWWHMTDRAVWRAVLYSTRPRLDVEPRVVEAPVPKFVQTFLTNTAVETCDVLRASATVVYRARSEAKRERPEIGGDLEASCQTTSLAVHASKALSLRIIFRRSSCFASMRGMM